MESPMSHTSGGNKKTKKQITLVSARKLAAMLWEMNNNFASPSVQEKKCDHHTSLKKEKLARSLHSQSLPSILSNSSRSSVSERMDRSGTGSRHRRSGTCSLMEIETRSQAHTPASSTIGIKTRLKDVRNSLAKSREILEIISRIWSDEDHPSSCFSTLQTELERAHVQVDQLIQEQHSDKNEMSYLMKCLAEEKAQWKTKEREIVEATIESIAAEREVERKLRRRFETLNTKLGTELAETKASLSKMVKELEREKRARETIEQVCYELVRDASKGKYEKEKVKIKRESIKVKLRNRLETFLGKKQVREKGCGTSHLSNEEIDAFLGRTRFGYDQNKDKEDVGEVEYHVECEDDSAENYLHCAELNMERNNSRSYKWAHPYESRFDSRRYPIEEGGKGRRSTSGRVSRRSTSLQTQE